MPNSVWPHRQQPTRLPRPSDSPGKNTGVGCHFLFQCMKVKSESEVAQSCLTLRDPIDCSLSGSSILGIFQAESLEWVEDNRFAVLCWFLMLVCTTLWLNYMYTYVPSLMSLPSPHLPPLGPHRAPSWAPCAIQISVYIPSAICFTQGSVYMSMCSISQR